MATAAAGSVATGQAGLAGITSGYTAGLAFERMPARRPGVMKKHTMKDRPFAPEALDISALCKTAGQLHGQQALAAMERLATSFCAATDGSVTWQAQGSLVPVTGGEPEMWLELQADAEVPLQCQRCLQAMNEALRVQRRFRFVRSEEDALRLDEESEDDVLLLPARLHLLEFLEDELMLALPIVPRHDACPTPLPLPTHSAERDEPAPNPFAALAAWRGGPSGGGGTSD